MLIPRTLPIALVAASLVLGACDKKADDKTADDKKSDDKAADKADEKAVDKPAEPAAPAVPELVETDISDKAKEFIPGFSGKLTVKIPAGAEVKQGVGGIDIKSEGFGMSITVGAYSVEEVKKRVESGEDPLDEEKVVDSGEGFLLYEGKAFGQHGFHVHADLPSISGLKAACATPIAQGFPEPNARKVVEACKSVTMTPG
jgi:hypothetical protein